MWSFNQKIVESNVESEDKKVEIFHPNLCECCEVCVENTEMYLDQQQLILNEQPSSQPAGYDPADHFSQPKQAQNKSPVDQNNSTNVLAYDLLSDYRDDSDDETVTDHCRTTVSQDVHGYEASCDENDDSPSSKVAEVIDDQTSQQSKHLGADEKLFDSPLQYPEEWDTHVLGCECPICGLSVVPPLIVPSAIIAATRTEQVLGTPQKKFRHSKPEPIKYCHNMEKRGHGKDDNNNDRRGNRKMI